MRHPAPSELVLLHFGEMESPRREACEAHIRDCAACRTPLADLAWVEEALLLGAEDGPPVDGLQRVLARIERVRPARARRANGLRAALPCGAALAAFGLAAHQGGLVAALALFAVGSVVTLSLAPLLILESQRRS
jgi:anti-sigma factor RsiW